LVPREKRDAEFTWGKGKVEKKGRKISRFHHSQMQTKQIQIATKQAEPDGGAAGGRRW